MAAFVKEGASGRAVLTTLLPVGAKCGTLLINYDTEDTTSVTIEGNVFLWPYSYENNEPAKGSRHRMGERGPV